MRRDYKQYYEENKLKNFYIKYDGKHYNDALIEDLIQDQPGSVALSSFITVRDNLEKLEDSTIQSFCLECQIYEYWARVILAILEEIEGYEKLHMLLSNEKGPFDTPEDVKAQEEYTSKYSEGFKNSCTLKEYEWMYVNQKICTLPIDTAKIIEEVFCYYDRVVKPRLTQKEVTIINDKQKLFEDMTHPNETTLIDVLNKLLKDIAKDKPDDQEAFAYKAISDWLACESEIWEDFITTNPPDKWGKYLYDRIMDLLDSFQAYIPHARADWDDMKSDSKYFYCMAMELYYGEICELRNKYYINNEYTKKIDELCWFLIDENDLNKYFNKILKSITKDKKLKEFLDEVTDYIDNFQGVGTLDTTRLYKDKIKEWVDQKNKEIGEDFVYKVPKEKRSLYLLNVARDTMDEFVNYLPSSHQNFLDLMKGQKWYYYYAMQSLFIRILDNLSIYNIESDEYEDKIKDLITVFFWDEDVVKENDNKRANHKNSNIKNSNTKRTDNQLALSPGLKKALDKAIAADYVSQTEDKYHWKLTRRDLVCFALAAHEQKLTTHKWKDIESLFGVKNLAQDNYQATNYTGSSSLANAIERLFK